MKNIFISIMLMMWVFQLGAQQEHQYTQFMYNKLLINPAYAGSRGVPSVTGLYRNQWLGFDGAPKSALVSFNTPFVASRVGAGLTLSHREIGLQQSLYASMSYSYDLIAKEAVSLRAGLMGSIRSLGMNFANAKPLLVGDASIDDAKINGTYANVGAGLYGTFLDQFYAGISVPHLYSNALDIDNPAAILKAKEYQHFYVMAGGSLPLNKDISILPAILVKYVNNAPIDVDLNVNLDIRRKVTTGLSYRMGGNGLGDSMDLLLFVQATPQVGIGAAYDFTLSDIKDYSSGSFEIMVQADLKKKKNNMSNPRFFF